MKKERREDAEKPERTEQKELELAFRLLGVESELEKHEILEILKSWKDWRQFSGNRLDLRKK